jgi:hypothetical protein
VHDERKKKKNKSKDLDNIDEEIIESSKDTLNPKVGKSNKKRTKCSYYNRGFYLECSCMVKTIDLMEEVLQQ